MTDPNIDDIELVDYCTLTLTDHLGGDISVANAARVSVGKCVEEMTEAEEGLIRYLMANKHGSPFEHNFFSFRVEAPIFVFREWHRHRVGHSYNEMSGRYVELRPRFFMPKEWRTQTGKPGAYKFKVMDDQDSSDSRRDTLYALRQAWTSYQLMLDRGVAREQARMVLPVNTMSEMIWSCNARSLMHFLALRTHSTAMKEIREVADAAEAIFAEYMPVTHRAWTSIGRVAP